MKKKNTSFPQKTGKKTLMYNQKTFSSQTVCVELGSRAQFYKEISNLCKFCKKVGLFLLGSCRSASCRGVEPEL